MIYLAIYAIFIPITLVAVFFMIRQAVSGKVLISFIRNNGTVKDKLVSPKGKYFKLKKEGERYEIDPNCVMYKDYPTGFPPFMQQRVPCLIFAENNPQSLNPKKITEKPAGMTAQMVESSINESLVKGISDSITADQKKPIPQWVIDIIQIALLAIIAFMIYSQGQNITSIMSALKIGE